MKINDALNLEIWDRLLRRESLVGLPLETLDGRLDLRGLELPTARLGQRVKVRETFVQEIEPGAIITNAKWHDFDFSNGKLNDIRLASCELKNCRFDHCQLKGLRIWDTTVSQCSFDTANLKNSAIGGVQNGRTNIYTDVDFSNADMRGTIYKATLFEGCIFRFTKLTGVDFQSSKFIDCIFEGELRDVLFYHRGFDGDAFSPNEMINVDFSKAKFHDVGFRGLTLEKVKLPSDAEHIIIQNFPSALDNAISVLQNQNDATAKQLIAFLNIDKKWIVPNRVQGVINTQDLKDTVGDEGFDRLIRILGEQQSGLV